MSNRNSQPKSASSLNGNAPDRANAILVLIDVINDLDFPNKIALLGNSRTPAKAIAKLKGRKRAGIPVIYVNNNHGKWRSDFSAVVRHSLRKNSPGKEMIQFFGLSRMIMLFSSRNIRPFMPHR